MAGHSKWANIKHRKERADQKKGKIFSSIIKELITAVKMGGSDPKSNSKLRLILEKAKKAGVPKENIDRNIKKASSGSSEGYEEVIYELYGHGGVGILAVALTDNKNRSASSMRIATNKKGGSIGSPGSVSYNFEKKGILHVPKKDVSEEDLFLILSESIAEDFEAEEEAFIVITKAEDLYTMKDFLEGHRLECDASLEYLAKSTVSCSKEDEEANFALIHFLEDDEDIDQVYHNMEI